MRDETLGASITAPNSITSRIVTFPQTITHHLDPLADALARSVSGLTRRFVRPGIVVLAMLIRRTATLGRARHERVSLQGTRSVQTNDLEPERDRTSLDERKRCAVLRRNFWWLSNELRKSSAGSCSARRLRNRPGITSRVWSDKCRLGLDQRFWSQQSWDKTQPTKYVPESVGNREVIRSLFLNCRKWRRISASTVKSCTSKRDCRTALARFGGRGTISRKEANLSHTLRLQRCKFL